MNGTDRSSLLALALRAVVASALAFSPAAWPAQNQPAKAKPTPASSAKEKSSGGGEREGIKVHGHWTIEVRNPDGTLVTRREFENSLVPNGSSGGGSGLLIAILDRQVIPGLWHVTFGGDSLFGLGAGPCSVNGASADCWITEPAAQNNPLLLTSAYQETVQNTSYNLAVSTQPISSGNNLALVLMGSMAVPNAFTVVAVGTALGMCDQKTTPLLCAAPPAGTAQAGGFLTSALLPSGGIPVQAGQIVTVTVVLTFS
jgi:hypothetical protein